jgi:hypothetical protein
VAAAIAPTAPLAKALIVDHRAALIASSQAIGHFALPFRRAQKNSGLPRNAHQERPEPFCLLSNGFNLLN